MLGTPAYMPPEQATGKVADIDHRSDIYSLGAILYEMLTLQPPVDKEGGYLAVLMRVMQGEIVSPERRNPQRARAGKIPRELSAVAMKALAKDPLDRYANVAALRTDIERFQEGRSVSAKQDSLREFAWKLVKRNKAVSLVTTLALLLMSVVWGRSAWINAQEREVRDQLMRDSVPAYVRSAHLCVNQGQFDDALAQVNIALAYEEKNTAARLLKAKVLLVKQDFKGAEAELQKYQQLGGTDDQASKLIDLCHRVDPKDPRTVAPLVEAFLENHEVALGMGMGEFQDQILAHYRKQIENAWPGLGGRLKLDTGGKLDLDFSQCGDKVADLKPLQKMPLTRLSLVECSKIADLRPLADLPLTSLNLQNCGAVKDLTPLKGLRLSSLILQGCGQVQDLRPLQGMPLVTLMLGSCRQLSDLTPLHGLPLTQLNLENCYQVQDLTPLQGLPLNILNLHGCPVRSLSPLEHMPLMSLHAANCSQLQDLTPLRGMPLIYLSIPGCQVTDLSPLQQMNLGELYFTPRNITKGIHVLREMKNLRTIGLNWSGTKWPASEFWKRYDAGEFK